MNNAVISEMKRVLDLQKQTQIKEGPPSLELRLDRIDRCISMVKKYEKKIIESLQQDFGNRDPVMSVMTEVESSVGSLNHAKKHIKRWTKPDKRSPVVPGLGSLIKILGAKAWIEYQPKGTVGVISPWNFPVNLILMPLAGIFAAGNRTMIKPSEMTPSTSSLLEEMFKDFYDESEAAVFNGDPEIGAAFSSLPFDHMIFTGGTEIAKHVMKAASDNLVPLTLELGGKSPVVVGESADISNVARRVMVGKTMNAGQICLAPDYALIPKNKIDSFVKESKKVVSSMFPSIKDNEDYTTNINQKHYERIKSYIEDAQSKGAEVEEINPSEEDFSQQEHHKIPPTLILNPTEDMKIMQEEIFGPVLPIKSTEELQESIDYINSKERPLGLYYFGEDSREQDHVLKRTVSGGVTLNDVIWHVGQENLPFGGIGPSGMGSYHGEEGFKEFSHAKSIYKQPKLDLMKLAGFVPPYKKKTENTSSTS